MPTCEALHELMEDHFANGWCLVPPVAIASLTAAPILSDQCDIDDQGNVSLQGRAFYFEQYQIVSEVAKLFEGGVIFQKA